MSDIAPLLLPWFEKHGRKNLPWQLQVSPYRVWLSEIMLQQTQVATVIPYFEKFLQSFPTIQLLAAADLDQVLAHWAGLGYYARARNLHKTANIVCDVYDGAFPQSMAGLVTLPGIGRSTAGAIASLAMGQSVGILDGNVKRVLCRVFQVKGWPGSTLTQKHLWSLVDSHTPAQNTALYNQAMMDLGSMVCTRSKPCCEECPLIKMCRSCHQGSQAAFPQKKLKQVRKKKHRWYLLNRSDRDILLQKRPAHGIWGGLWCLPELEKLEQLSGWQIDHIGQMQQLDKVREKVLKHRFTHFDLSLSIAEIKYDTRFKKQSKNMVCEQDEWRWMNQESIQQIGLPTPIKQIVFEYLDYI